MAGEARSRADRDVVGAFVGRRARFAEGGTGGRSAALRPLVPVDALQVRGGWAFTAQVNSGMDPQQKP
jgi:hypothetical protein